MYVTVIDGNKEDNKVQEVLIVEESSSKVDKIMENIHVEKSMDEKAINRQRDDQNVSNNLSSNIVAATKTK